MNKLLGFLACLSAALCVLSGSLAEAHDLTALPLGDNKHSTAPRKGWIWPCRIEPDAGGAFRDGPWINKSAGTYDLTRKSVVPGSVRWPYNLQVTVQGNQRVFSTNDYPSHPTGIYPIPSDSEAYRYDRNPNRISAQNMLLQLPVNPVLAAQATCTPGAVGILLSGAVLFNALDAPGRDAVAHETQDACQGHPQVSGVYHYHSVSPCVDTRRDADGHSTLVGYMLDGFGIYGHFGEGGKELTSNDLDECHGHTHTITWDGKKVSMYHYHATWDFPYTAGCMRGTYNRRDVMTISGPPPNQGNNPGGIGGPGTGGPGMGGSGIGGQGMGSGPPDGPRGGPPGGPGGGRPNLDVAAAKLGISTEQLRAALGPPPPDFDGAARRLGISPDRLRDALESSR